MRNVRALLHYDGTNYHGWQSQPNCVTIQGVLTEVLSRLDDREVVVHGAGRTDAGVHAEGQVASFFFLRPMSEQELVRAVNGNLPRDIRVRQIAVVDPEFHARLSAAAKTYRYVFYLGEVVSPFIHRYVYHCLMHLDVNLIRRAASLFEGEHDFAAFCSKSHDQNSTVRRVTRLEVVNTAETLELDVTANGFLRSMVRRIAGTLWEVGRGRLTPEEVAGLLDGKSGGVGGPSLPARGLTLVRVDY
jgi:tRNA pseudouridine38-40 synthase